MGVCTRKSATVIDWRFHAPPLLPGALPVFVANLSVCCIAGSLVADRELGRPCADRSSSLLGSRTDILDTEGIGVLHWPKSSECCESAHTQPHHDQEKLE